MKSIQRRDRNEVELQNIGHITLPELQKLRVEEDQIPNWVFDVHTLKGKYKLKKTDLDMIMSEEEALKPHQYSMFDYGDWAEYYEDAVKKGKIDPKQQQDVKEFQKRQRELQEKHGTTNNFNRL